MAVKWSLKAATVAASQTARHKYGEPRLDIRPSDFGFTRLARLWIKPCVGDELGHGRKFLNITADFGENDSSKRLTHARNRLKFGVKIVHKASNLFVENG